MILDQIVFWHWWILAALLLIGEMATWTVYFFWMAFAAAITGLVKFFAPNLQWEWQFLIFAILCIASLYVWWRYNKNTPLTKEQQVLNRRADRLIGQVVTLETPIQGGQGKARVGDSLWLVSCQQDLPAGTKVAVTQADSAILHVEAIKDGQLNITTNR